MDFYELSVVRIQMSKLRYILVSALAMLLGLEASSQSLKVVRTVEHVVYFRQGQAVIDPYYMDNARRLANLIKDIEIITMDQETELKDIRIVAGASPEGVSTWNYDLSALRAESMAAFISSNIAMAESYLKVEYISIDWDGLAGMVQRSDRIPYKEQMYKILTETPIWIRKNGVIVDGRRRSMERLDGEKPYWWMVSNMFPYVRKAVVTVSYLSDKDFGMNIDRLTALEPSSYRLEQSSVLAGTGKGGRAEETAPQMQDKPERRSFVMALKTNMLSDVAAVPDLGVEFHLGGGVSIAANYKHAWWSIEEHDWFWRYVGADLTLRKYFGKKSREIPLSGHHVGIYGQAFTFDFELGETGWLADRFNYAAGLEYGYSVPVGKAFNLDFSIGGGIHLGEYKTYLPVDDCYVWQATKQRMWFGPTKAEISLVWLIGNRSYYKRR